MNHARRSQAGFVHDEIARLRGGLVLYQMELQRLRVHSGSLHFLYRPARSCKPDYFVSMLFKGRLESFERSCLTDSSQALESGESVAATQNLGHSLRLGLVQIGIALLDVRCRPVFELLAGILRCDNLPENLTFLADCLGRRIALARRELADMIHLKKKLLLFPAGDFFTDIVQGQFALPVA